MSRYATWRRRPGDPDSWSGWLLRGGGPPAAPGEESGPGESWAVRALVHDVDGALTGSDRGWLILSEGWLLFEGERTSFALTANEAKPTRSAFASLRLEDGRGVAFAAVGRGVGPSPLRRIVERWTHEPVPAGEAVLPPSGTHPEVWARHLRHCGAAVVVTAIPAVLGTLHGTWPVVLPALVFLGVSTNNVVQTSRLLRESLFAARPSPRPRMEVADGG